MKPSMHWLDRATATVAPRWTMKRARARMAVEMMARHYEGASAGRRTQGWNKSGADANSAIGPALKTLREVARDLARNNALAQGALRIIGDHAVGYGIQAKPNPSNARVLDAWKRWAETTACDADGRHDFYGLQKLVMRTVAESGEVLVRRRLRRPEDGLPLPLQLQVLDPDFLDTSRDSVTTGNGLNRIIQGVEFDAIGRRVGYWMFREHPGSSFSTVGASVFVPADQVVHVFQPMRPGQVRGPSWFAPVLLRFKDWDDLADATLMKQKIAACLAVITSDVDGEAPPFGVASDSGVAGQPQIDTLEPGLIANIAPGRTIEVVQPPSVREYVDYSKTVLREIATGLGVTYEDLTGDYSEMNFSASRASHIKHWQAVDDWRWRMLIPQFCDPAWMWFLQVGQMMNLFDAEPMAAWSPPPTPLVDPVNEGLAFQRDIRNGTTTLQEVIRSRGLDPDEVFAEIADTNRKLDALGIVLDTDPRKMTQAGQMQSAMTPEKAPEDEAQSARALLHAVSGRR